MSALAILVLAAAVCAQTATSDDKAASSTSAQTTAQTQSVSGKIASVERSSFTLDVTSAQRMNESAQSSSSAKSMTFQIDKNTTIDGKLKVGAMADVTYREEAGSNIAINGRVTPTT